MNANRYGDLVGGQGGGHNCLKLVGQPAYQIPGIDGGMWLDDETFISRKQVALVTFSRSTGFAIAEYFNAAGNEWACGGGNWATTDRGGQPYESWGSFNGAPLPTRYQLGWAIQDASRDGALLWALNGQYEVLWPDGRIQQISGTWLEARLSWDGHAVALLNPENVMVAWSDGIYTNVPLVSKVALNKPAMCGVYVSYATAIGRFVHFTGDAANGWATTPVYAPELYIVGHIHAAGSLGPAELPSEVVIDLLDRPMIALPPPTPIDPPDPPDPVPPVETPMPNLFLKTRNDLFLSCDTRDGTRKIVALAHKGGENADGVFSIWKPILTRGTKVGEDNNLCYFDCANFPGNTMGIGWDAVGVQVACPIRTGTAFTPLLKGDDHDWVIFTEPTFALTYLHEKADGIYLEPFGTVARSIQSMRFVEAKANGTEGQIYTAPFK